MKNNQRDLKNISESGGSRGFFYTYEDLADLFGVGVGTVRWMVYRKMFNPTDLKSVCELYLERKAS